MDTPGGRLPWIHPAGDSRGYTRRATLVDTPDGRLPWICPMGDSRGYTRWVTPVDTPDVRLPWMHPMGDSREYILAVCSQLCTDLMKSNQSVAVCTLNITGKPADVDNLMDLFMILRISVTIHGWQMWNGLTISSLSCVNAACS